MTTGFITLTSRLTIKNGTLIEKKVKVDSEESFNRFAAFVALVALLAYSLYEVVYEKDYFNMVQVMLILFWLEPHVKRIYKTLFVYSWRSAIRLSEIKSVTSVPQANGLETVVTVRLANDRVKQYTFRNAEQQLEGFMAALNAQESVVATP